MGLPRWPCVPCFARLPRSSPRSRGRGWGSLAGLARPAPPASRAHLPAAVGVDGAPSLALRALLRPLPGLICPQPWARMGLPRWPCVPCFARLPRSSARSRARGRGSLAGLVRPAPPASRAHLPAGVGEDGTPSLASRCLLRPPPALICLQAWARTGLPRWPRVACFARLPRSSPCRRGRGRGSLAGLVRPAPPASRAHLPVGVGEDGAPSLALRALLRPLPGLICSQPWARTGLPWGRAGRVAERRGMRLPLMAEPVRLMGEPACA